MIILAYVFKTFRDNSLLWIISQSLFERTGFKLEHSV